MVRSKPLVMQFDTPGPAATSTPHDGSSPSVDKASKTASEHAKKQVGVHPTRSIPHLDGDHSFDR
jgi:hypothetical protein